MTAQNTTERGSIQAADFWHKIFRDVAGYLELWSGFRKNEEIPSYTIRQDFFRYPEEVEKAQEWALDRTREGREVYFCARLLTFRKRSKNDPKEVNCLYADLDGAEVPNGRLTPSVVVESSPGRYHCYWLLIDAVHPEMAERLNKRLAQEIGADPSGADLAQILRVPGTVNHKYDGAPTARALEISDKVYSPRELDEALPAEVEEPEREAYEQGEEGDDPPVALGPKALRVWRGEDPKYRGDGRLDRSGTLLKIGRVLFDAGANRSVIVPALAERDAMLYRKYTERTDAEQRYHEIVDELESNGRNGSVSLSIKDQNSATPPKCFNLTDLGNARRLIARHGADLRYCFPWGAWLVWDGRHWSVDDRGEVRERAKETVAAIYEEAATAGDEERRKALAKHAVRSESGSRIKEMIDLAKSEVPITPDELDGDPWLLSCENGTINLRTGKLREHRREDLITKIAPLEYRPDANAPTWQKTLERVLPNPEIRAFFKRLCGYALTGDTSEHVLPMLYGTGANGKSTVLNALLETLGDYGMQAAPDLLIAKKNSHPTELADLFGSRFVASIEVEDGRRLADSLVKQLTGGDRIKARRMRQDFWEFPPTHKVFMAVNHKPTVRGTDNAIWRRIRLIPFTETIPPNEQDKKLPTKLRDERSGILAWAVEGCQEWQHEGLQAPDEVRKATGEYRSEMDVLGAFLRECCQKTEEGRIAAKDLYDAYKLWCEESGERYETQRRFAGQLKDRSTFERRRSGPNGSYEWHGLQLLNLWKAAICRKTELTEEKLTINTPKDTPREEMGNLGSEGSEDSVGHPLYYDVEPGQSTTLPELRSHRLTAEQARQVQKLVSEGMAPKFARAEVLGGEV